jgi:hypothetical protein
MGGTRALRSHEDATVSQDRDVSIPDGGLQRSTVMSNVDDEIDNNG